MALHIIFGVFLAFFLFKFLSTLYKLIIIMPSNKGIKRIMAISNIGKNKVSAFDKMVIKFEKFMSSAGLTLLNNVSREKLDKDLRRAGINKTPERFIAEQYLYPAMIIGSSTLLSILLSKLPAVSYLFFGAGLLLGIMSFFVPKSELNKMLDEKHNKIILEVPRLIKTYQYSPDSKGFDEIVKDYIKTAKSGLKYDLELLLSDLEGGIPEVTAIQRFGDRTNMPEMRELSAVLQAARNNKKDSQISLQFIEAKFREKAKQLIDNELKKRPPKLDLINELLLQALLLLFMVPMLISSFTGITSMMK